MTNKKAPPLHVGKPKWLKTPIARGKTFFQIKSEVREKKLVTVCEEAKCPNISTCWNTATATFMVLGDVCTRACRFCNIKTGNPAGLLDKDEPRRVARSCQVMKLKYVVLTMVDRDDLPDGGADHVTQVVRAIHEKNPGIKVEVLSGDWAGSSSSLATVLGEKFSVFAHNVETVRRLTPRVRDRRAGYDSSLKVLKEAKSLVDYPLYTKSALMLGLGETVDEVKETLRDLRNSDVDIVTVGQYMRPSKRHLSIKDWVLPEVFCKIEEYAYEIGFLAVASGPLIRSSYKADHFFEMARRKESLRQPKAAL